MIYLSMVARQWHLGKHCQASAGYENESLYWFIVPINICHQIRLLRYTGCIRKKECNFGMPLCVNYWVYEHNFCMVIKSKVFAVE